MFYKTLLSLLFALIFSTVSDPLNADESESRVKSGLISKTLRFDTNKQPITPDHNELQEWANSTLKEEAGLSRSSRFSVSKKRSTYKHGETYKIFQTHLGLPVEQLEGVITLTKDSRPKKVRGRMEAIDFTGNTKPSITIRQALDSAGHIQNTPNEGQLAFWLDADSKPILSYKLEGRFKVNGDEGDQIVFVDAHSGKVLSRVSNEFSLLETHI